MTRTTAFSPDIYMIVFALALQCSKYLCANSTLTNDACIVYKPDQDTYYLDPCKKSTETCIPTHDQQNVYCIDFNSNTPTTFSYPGEKCVKNDDCVYGTCVNKICVGSGKGVGCQSNTECDSGLYCNKVSNECTIQVEAGGSCEDDYQCVNNAACDGKICTQYFSVDANKQVSQCENNTSYLCITGTCIASGATYVCSFAPKSNSTLPVTCTSSSACKSQPLSNFNNQAFTTNCECGYNDEGTAYCGLQKGDLLYMKYWVITVSWMRTSEIMYCNTERRFAENCQATYWTSKSLELYNYYQQTVTNYPLLQNNTNCIKKIFFPNYYTLEDEVTGDSESDSALLLATTLMTIIPYLF
mmetsp:Transcript_16821/g.30069  ORF Transcript_16821/g.30069 Transcript_16821/m.30069 type:complete len:356 (+) Transcript_16821:20627-21694(+)